MSKRTTTSSGGCGCATIIPATLTAIVGNHIHHSIFWTIMDFLFWPLAIIKWIIFHEITMTIVKESFSWFFR